MTRQRGDGGETLLEILFTIVILGLTVGALLSSLAAVGRAGTAQRNSVKADFVLRNYAEATKAATQSCVVGGTYSVVYPGTLPTGYTPSGAGTTCPASVTSPTLLTLKVVGPLGLQTTMQIKVNTP